jgi:ribosomal protein S12 methylthiotransferase accessory factor
MIAKPSGVVQLFGPVFVPGKTACWECLAHRLRGRRALERYLELCGKSSPVAQVSTPVGLSALSARLAALQAAKWIVFLENPQLAGRIVSLDICTLATASHIVTPRPQCPSCGESNHIAVSIRPPVLDNRPKLMSGDSGHAAFFWAKSSPDTSITSVQSQASSAHLSQ